MVETTAETQTGAQSVFWDLSIFYSGIDDPAIEQDMQTLSQAVDEFASTYKGRVGRLSAQEMRRAYEAVEQILDKNGRISTFAFLTYAIDTNNPEYGALVQKITEFNAQINQKLLFFDLEWNNLDDEAAQELMNDPAVAKYRHHLEAERRYKPFQLSEPEEQLLVEKSVTGRNAWTRFFTQLMGMMRYEYEGEQLTQEQILIKLYDPDREVRRKANDSVTNGLRERAMELTYVFNVLAADKASDDNKRGYDTWISSRNLANKTSDEIVETLVNAVTANYDLVARHYNLKRTLLDYDQLTEYDRYAPLPLKDSDKTYQWEDARDIVLNAYDAFSPEMAAIARRFFEENWIHAALQPGKRGGAFSASSVPSAHPFVLVNYTGKAKDVMTLAHELGHGVHQHLANETQGLLNSSTPLTTAEMASTFGEMLVFNDLMEKEPDAEAQLAMLLQKIDDTFATVFRQISMNRFEDLLHNTRRAEGELSAERISELWLQSQRAMFQDSVNLSDDYGIWWSYVPHFLGTPGYVYAYAFGELLVFALFNLYQERGAEFTPQYIDVLAAGGSDWPHEILGRLGIDLTDPNFWNAGLDAIRGLIEKEERLARQVYAEKFTS